jgi:hypothetical protein
MEDVLDLYALPPDARRPLVCFDERPVQLVAHTRTPIPPAPGRPARIDYEYSRRGTCNLFTFFAPHLGWRHVEVTDRRTKRDFALMMKALVDAYFPYATVIRVVLDNLNIHALASLYDAFPPAEARRIAKRLELHHTPKHGSWLNMAEAEIALLSRQALDQRLPDAEAVRRALAARERPLNDARATVSWRFTVPDARASEAPAPVTRPRPGTRVGAVRWSRALSRGGRRRRCGAAPDRRSSGRRPPSSCRRARGRCRVPTRG